MMLLVSTPRVYTCSSGDYVDPDGKDLYYFEECMHMERKFNDEIFKKCKQYSEQKIIEYQSI